MKNYYNRYYLMVSCSFRTSSVTWWVFFPPFATTETFSRPSVDSATFPIFVLCLRRRLNAASWSVLDISAHRRWSISSHLAEVLNTKFPWLVNARFKSVNCLLTMSCNVLISSGICWAFHWAANFKILLVLLQLLFVQRLSLIFMWMIHEFMIGWTLFVM